MVLQDISIWIGIISFFLALLTNTIIWIYTYGKLRGKMEAREQSIDKELTTINEKINSIGKSNLDSEGDIKWILKKDHQLQCAEHGRVLLMETDNIKGSIDGVKKSIVSIQDSLLSLATSGRFKGKGIND